MDKDSLGALESIECVFSRPYLDCRCRRRGSSEEAQRAVEAHRALSRARHASPTTLPSSTDSLTSALGVGPRGRR